MERTDTTLLTLLQLKALVYYSRFLVRLYRLKHAAHEFIGIYPLRRKWLLKIFSMRIHLTVSVEPQMYHWVNSD